MSSTARLSLPYIAPQQAQKQVTHNEAMAALDQLVQPVVKSRTLATPPGSPSEGDTYIVAPSATGAWTGKDNAFAAWLSGAWTFTTPAEGWIAYVADTAELAVLQGGAWTSFVTLGGTALAKLGINATATLTDRLTVASDAVLLTHDGTSQRLTVNKATAVDTASLILADALSGRAEIGLSGDDNLHIKISPDGVTWIEALNIDRSSGLLSLADARFQLYDDADPTRIAHWDLGNIATGTTRTYTLPNVSGTFAMLTGTQTFGGVSTFNNTFTQSGTTGSFGTATATATYGLGSGATVSGSTKTINIGTAGVSGSSTAITLGSAVSGASNATTINGPVTLAGGQLSFPATQVPSANANTLDDYEEGTWTPSILFGAASTGITYSTQAGRYTKIGRTVIVSCNIVLSSKGTATGAAQVGGLPFTSANDGIYAAAAVGLAAGMSSVTGAVSLMVKPNDVLLNVYHSNNGAGAGLTNSNFTNTSQVYFSATYDVA